MANDVNEHMKDHIFELRIACVAEEPGGETTEKPPARMTGIFFPRDRSNKQHRYLARINKKMTEKALS